jgi:hypothetical protein
MATGTAFLKILTPNISKHNTLNYVTQLQNAGWTSVKNKVAYHNFQPYKIASWNKDKPCYTLKIYSDILKPNLLQVKSQKQINHKTHQKRKNFS